MQKNVFWFDISVDDITVMHKLNCMADLSSDASNFLLRKSTLISKATIYVATTAKF